MRDADVGDDRDVRLRELRKRRDFAGMIHPDFPDRDFVLAARFEHGAREADVIVEIAFGFGDAIAAREDGGGEILCAGFAVAPGNGDDFQA